MQVGVGLLILDVMPIQWSLPGYRLNYLKFYQLPNSNLFTRPMLFFLREATSEIYGPRVYSLSYFPLRHIFIRFYFQIYYSKNPKIPCCNFFAIYFIFHFRKIYLSNLLQTNLSFTWEGLATPFTRRVASICSLCAGTVYIVLCGSPNGSITLV